MGDITPELPYSILQKTVPHLEKKNEIISNENDVSGGLVDKKYDKKQNNGGLYKLISEEIQKKPGIHLKELVNIFHGNISPRTLERRLKEMISYGMIKSRRGGNERGYYTV